MQISVVTPTFNAVNFIDQCVNNVCEQGDVILEHIIVDGGSTDGTLDAVERLISAHAHIRLLRGPDKGQSDAMNKGSASARGDIIGMLNVDDYYERGAAAEAEAMLSNCRAPAIVVGDCRVIDENDKLLWWNRPKDLKLEKLLQPYFRYALPANPSAYFYHRTVHDIVGGYDEMNHFSMDIDFLLRAFRKVDAVYVPRHWGNFRLMPGCKSYQNQTNDLDPVGAIMDRERGYLSQKQLLIFYAIKYRDLARDKRRKLASALGFQRSSETEAA